MGMQGVIPPNIDYSKSVSDGYKKKIYKKGETCIKYNKLYQAKEDIDEPEEWNPEHWKETTVEQIRAQMQQEIEAVNTNIANITPDDTAVDGKPWTSKHIVEMLCPPLKVSGNPVQCYPVAGYPLGITASWEPTQDGTGDPSPENIRPIKGRDSVTVMRYPTNILKNTAVSGEKVGVTVTVNDDGSILLNGTSGSNFYAVGIELATITFVKGITYTISGVAGYTSKSLQLFTESSYAFPLGNRLACSEKATTATALKTEKCKVFLYLYPNITYNNVLVYPMITIGSEKNETYTPGAVEDTEITLTLPETIYGGSVDAVSGEGQEEWKVLTLDGTENWSNQESRYDNSETTFFSLILPVSEIGISNGIALSNYFASSDAGKNIQDASLTYPCIGRNPEGKYSNYLYIRAKNTIIGVTSDTPSAKKVICFKQWLTSCETPVQVAYKLVALKSFQADGGSIVPAVEGINTILTDADTVAVTARKDPVRLFGGLSS